MFPNEACRFIPINISCRALNHPIRKTPTRIGRSIFCQFARQSSLTAKTSGYVMDSKQAFQLWQRRFKRHAVHARGSRQAQVMRFAKWVDTEIKGTARNQRFPSLAFSLCQRHNSPCLGKLQRNTRGSVGFLSQNASFKGVAFARQWSQIIHSQPHRFLHFSLKVV